MNDKHLIIGTAGHVDHGKTALIQALTGFDCDTHKQEKERGITINLGFSNLLLPNGIQTGIIDVPGHADFIKTMVAGACGIDIVLFVISADDGIMQQTAEHLEIMKILGLKYGIIVLTKVDLVDEELLELAVDEIKEFVKDSFLEESPVIQFSAKSEQGKSELIKKLSEMTDNISGRDIKGHFRMYVDRTFVKEGFGTILNGSVLSGKISIKDKLLLLPQNKELRIRKIQRYSKEVEQVQAGDRASFNVSGFKSKDYKRGIVLSEISLQTTKLIDVKFTLFTDAPALKLWNQVMFLHETNRLMVRMHLLESDFLQPEDTGLVQIYLPQPIIAEIGDKYIIRNSSGNATLGGGTIIDNHPLHHRRRREMQIELVQKIASGELKELVAAEVRKSILPISHKRIAENINEDPDNLINVIFNELTSEIKFYQTSDDIILIQKKIDTKYKNKILSGLQEFHKKNPLNENGRKFFEIMGIFGNKKEDNLSIFLNLMLAEMEEENKIRKTNNTWVLANHNVQISLQMQQQIDEILNYLEAQKSFGTDIEDLKTDLQNKGISQIDINSIVKYLIDKDRIVLTSNKLILSSIISGFRKELVNYLQVNPSGIKVADFRDLIKSNRTNSMLVLNYFDDRNITVRKGDVRVLTQRFLNRIKGK